MGQANQLNYVLFHHNIMVMLVHEAAWLLVLQASNQAQQSVIANSLRDRRVG